MSHIEKLQDYLIDKNKGYLIRDISKGKIIMLSGLWGSGKTYFWQEKIANVENIKKNNIYISLYGKKSIEDIENEIISKSILNEFPDNKNLINNISTFANITKNISNLFLPKSGEAIDKIQILIKEKFSNHSLKEGTLICFDDFERKSREIDLNDLFGFITQIALNIKCRVVIIINSDVFKGKEKEIFTNVKEKSVSKYISFAPDCKELFNLVFDIEEENKKKYQSVLNEHKTVLEKSFEEINIVNARIMMQTLDNLLEWIENKNPKDNDTLRIFVLINSNFILNHQVFIANIASRDKNEVNNMVETIKSMNTNHQPRKYPIQSEIYIEYRVKYNNKIPSDIEKDINKHITNDFYDENIIENLKYMIELEGKDNLTKSGKADKSQTLLSYIENNNFSIKSTHFMYYFKINQYCKNDESKVEIFNKINDFIEMGML